MVYVLNKDGKPLMPTKRYAKIRILRKRGLLKIVNNINLERQINEQINKSLLKTKLTKNQKKMFIQLMEENEESDNYMLFNSNLENIIKLKELIKDGNNLDKILKAYIDRKTIYVVTDDNNTVRRNKHLDNYLYNMSIFFDSNLYDELNNRFNETKIVNRLSKQIVNDQFNYILLSDMAYMFDRIKTFNQSFILNVPRKFTFRELEQAINDELYYINNGKYEYKYDERAYELNDTINDLYFKVADGNEELKDTGREMHICVGGYGNNVMSKYSFIVTATDVNTNKKICCIEIDPMTGEFMQIKAVCNEHADAELMQTVAKWANKHDIKLSENLIYDVYETEAHLFTCKKANVIFGENYTIESIRLIESLNSEYSTQARRRRDAIVEPMPVQL